MIAKWLRIFKSIDLIGAITLAGLIILAEDGYAANPCSFDAGGIGGTGHRLEQGGIGGTGHRLDQGGMGGTGRQLDEGGIGGTGRSLDEGGIGETGHSLNEGGIGGTGIRTAVEEFGIIGTVTGFASVCVNGVEVHYDASTPVRVDGQPASQQSLAVGQVVEVASRMSNKKLMARSINVKTAVAGPISQVDKAMRRISVLGQTVEIGPRTRTVKRAGLRSSAVNSLKVGQFVNVSGLRTADGIVSASRIEKTERSASLKVRGPVRSIAADSIQIEGLTVAFDKTTFPQGLRKGRNVTVSGSLSDGVLKARQVNVSPLLPFAGKVRRLNVEGHVSNRPSSQGFRIGDVDVEVTSTTRLSGGALSTVSRDRRVIVSGRITPAGKLRADSIRFSRDIERSDSDLQAPKGKNQESDNSGSKEDSDDAGREDRSGKDDGREETDREEREDRSGKQDRSEDVKDDDRVEQSDRFDREDRSGSSDNDDRPDGSGRSGRGGDAERIERADESERIERTEKPDRSGSSERPDRPDASGKSERPDRPDKLDRLEKPDRSGKPERPERLERPDKVERPDKPDRPDKIERPERPDRPDRSGRPDRPDRLDRSGRH